MEYSVQRIADILIAVSNEVSHVCVVCREPCEVRFFTSASGRTRYYKWVCLFTLCMVPKLASSVQSNLLQNQFIRFKNIMFYSQVCAGRGTLKPYITRNTCLHHRRHVCYCYAQYPQPQRVTKCDNYRTASTELLMIHYRLIAGLEKT